jgi:hypothetical protein
LRSRLIAVSATHSDIAGMPSAPALPTWSRFYEHDIQTRNRTPRRGTCGVVPPACMPFRRSATAPPQDHLSAVASPKKLCALRAHSSGLPSACQFGISRISFFSLLLQSSSPTISGSQPSRMS